MFQAVLIIGSLGRVRPCDVTVRPDEYPISRHRLDRVADDEGQAFGELPARASSQASMRSLGPAPAIRTSIIKNLHTESVREGPR
ncbi:hypothetical protein MMAG44476_35246 [Mycolicibacterium mageritense DSM 44476 = CIP 104973]